MLNTPLNLPFYYSAICEVRGRVQQFSVPNIIDLGSFANQMWLTIPTRALQNLVGNLSLSIQSAIVYERHLSGIPGTTGLAVNFDLYQPTSLSFLNNSQYEQFLANFHLIGETIETAIVPLQAGPLIGYLDGENDSVYYRYDPQIAAQHTLHLTAFQPIGEDFDLYLFDSNMNFLTRSVETGSTETIQYAFVPGQIYYIRAFSHPVPDSDFGFGAFQIAITYSPPINPASIALIIGIIAAIAVMIFVISYIVYHNRSKIATALRQLRTNDQRQIESPPQGDLESQTSTECIQCGESLPENAKFCPNCGKIFEEPSEESGKVED